MASMPRKRDEMDVMCSRCKSVECICGDVAFEQWISALSAPITLEECQEHGEIANPNEEGSPWIFNAGDFDRIIAARIAKRR